MTREEIIRATQVNFEEFYTVWSRNMDRRGMGALVFICGDNATADTEIEFAYLTMRELRDFLSTVPDNRASLYRWVKQAESAQGIPVLILPRFGPHNPQFPFSSLTRG